MRTIYGHGLCLFCHRCGWQTHSEDLLISLDSIECLHTIEDNLLVLLMTSRWMMVYL